jgi:hypothetical protein
MHDVSLGHLLLDRLDERFPHVHRHGLAERFPQPVSGLCGSLCNLKTGKALRDPNLN